MTRNDYRGGEGSADGNFQVRPGAAQKGVLRTMGPLGGRETAAAGSRFPAWVRTESTTGGVAATAAAPEFALRVAVAVEGLTAGAGNEGLGATWVTGAGWLVSGVDCFGKEMSGPGAAPVAGVLVGVAIASKDARLVRIRRTPKSAAAASSTTSDAAVNHRRRRASPGISIGSS